MSDNMKLQGDKLTHMVEGEQSSPKPDYAQIVHTLESIATQWVQQTARDLKVKTEFTKDLVPCRVFLHGSVALGLGSQSTDMDAVLLVPRFIDRTDFFSFFLDCLKKHTNITDTLAIADTLVPLIRMHVDGIQVDLSLSVYGRSCIPSSLDFEVEPGQLYYNMDSASVRSLSGVHLNHVIRQQLEKDTAFFTLLCAVRVWFRARAISGYVFGFPPTVGWNILVVFLCKEISNHSKQFDATCMCHHSDSGSHSNPNGHRHSVACLLYQFFSLFASWPWPRPVMCAPIQMVHGLSVLPWDPQKDDGALMPIINPVYPNNNVAFSIRATSRQIVTRELIRGRDIVRAILKNGECWDKLFEKFDIRAEYRHFLLITLKTVSAMEFNEVGSLVNSRLRDLAQCLEDENYIRGTRICRVPSTSNSSHTPPTPFVDQWLIAMDIEPGPRLPDGSRVAHNVDVTGCVATFYQILRERDQITDFRSKLTCEYVKRSQLKSFVL